MPKNTIKVTIPFSFKGVEHTPSSVIDLDRVVIESKQSLQNLSRLVANENKIDAYSYEYEVLESSPQIFSDPTGLAVGFLQGNDFDLEGYKNNYKQEEIENILRGIANEVLNIDNLDAHSDIKKALLKAYNAGNKVAI